MSRPKPKTYRLALYGRAGSGKTCILAALAMPRPPHPRSSTCARIYPDSTSGRARYAAQSGGHDWLEAAISQLSKGDTPKPNPIEHPTGRVLRYGFTAAEVPEFRVELFDYAGELVDPLKHKDPKDLAAVLLNHLETIDGLLILIEAPRGERYDPDQIRDILLMAEGFAELKTDRAVPVALLVTKWDRRARLEDATPKAEDERLAALLDSGAVPALTRLRDTIRNAVGETNTRAFPVSAFGGHEQRDGQDYPRAGTLHAFGLEDPFVWIAARRDALDLKILEREVGSLKGIGLLSPRSWLRVVWNRQGDLRDRYRDESPGRSAVLRLLHRRQWLIAGLVLALILLVGFSWAVGEAIKDARDDSTARLAERPAATDQEIEEAIAWLERYSQSAPIWHAIYSHLVLTRADARAKIREYQDRFERQLWNIVLNLEPDKQKQVGPAEAYLREFPKGLHETEAKTILTEAEALLARRENDRALERVEQEVKALLPGADIELLKQVLAKAEALPPRPEWETDDQQKRRRALASEVGDQLRELTSLIDWKQFLKVYEDHMDKGRLKEAAQLLVPRQPEDDNLQALRVQFMADAPKLIRRKVDELTNGDIRWADAYALLDGYDRWPVEVQSHELKEAVGAARKTVAERQDKWLYDEVVKKKQEKQVADYLNDAPIRSMASEVGRYREYLAQRRGKRKLRLILDRIEWAEKCWNNSYNIVTVRVNGRKAIEKTGVTSRYLTSTGGFDPYDFEGAPDDRVKIEIKIINDDYAIGGGDHVHGEAVSEERIEGLAQGRTLQLRFDHDVNQAVFVVSGLPAEPPLTPWRPRP
jgi:hypothetical protein